MMFSVSLKRYSVNQVKLNCASVCGSLGPVLSEKRKVLFDKLKILHGTIYT